MNFSQQLAKYIADYLSYGERLHLAHRLRHIAASLDKERATSCVSGSSQEHPADLAH
jgi:hypothetical protein